VPEVVIIAGPNGAGKTTFAREYMAGTQKHLVFVNADEIARELVYQGLTQEQLDLHAARNMLERIGDLADAGADFMFETTLATLTYAQKIPRWQRSGYSVSLIYLRLHSVEESLAGYGGELRQAVTAFRKKPFAGASKKAWATSRAPTNPLSMNGMFGIVPRVVLRWRGRGIKGESQTRHRDRRRRLEASCGQGDSRRARGAFRALPACSTIDDEVH
jgi:hypothetical protein